MVTSDALRRRPRDELVSPELALVDPVLSARLRASLPQRGGKPTTSERQPTREGAVRVPRFAPVVSTSSDVAGASQAPCMRPPDESPLRRTLTALATGAVMGVVVTVGVIAELDSGRGSPTILRPPTAQPVTPPPPSPAWSPADDGLDEAPFGAPTVEESEGNDQATNGLEVSGRQDHPRRQDHPPGSRSPAAARRFAWAPVRGAVGYRVELFRGDRRVLRATTTEPVFELVGRWRHRGRAESLVAGRYRWLVWPIQRNGPRARAAVQAKLTVP